MTNRGDGMSRHSDAKHHARGNIAAAERRYRVTKNPLWAFEACAEATSNDLPLPRWVLEYFHRISVHLCELSRSDIPRKSRIYRAIAKALEFPIGRRGRRNPFAELTDEIHRAWIILAMDYEIGAGHKPYIGAELAAKAHARECDRSGCRPTPMSVLRLWQRERKSMTSGNQEP
jgi:hypothetical protein